MLDQAWEALRALDWGGDLGPLAAIDAAIDSAHGDAAAKSELEQKFVVLLHEDLSLAARDYICRRLVTIGGAGCVPTVAAMLGDPQTSHLARMVLEQIDLPESRAAMRDAAALAQGTVKIGLLGSLAKLDDQESVGLFTAALVDDHAEVRQTAVWCLGQVGGSQAVESLSAVDMDSDDSGMRIAMTDAMLACADRMLANGERTQAMALYRKFTGEEQPPHVRVAANRGVLASVRR